MTAENNEAKTIWIVNQYAYTPEDSAGTRHFTYAKGLRDAGFNVHVVSSSFYHKGRRQRHLKKNQIMQMTVESSVPFAWLKVPSYRGNLSRIFNMLVFAIQLHRLEVKKKLPRPDVIIGTSPSPFAALSALLLAKSFRVKFFTEVVDIWPLTLIEVNHSSRFNPMILVFGVIEKLLMKKSDGVITHLSKGSEHFQSIGADADKCHFIPSPTVMDDTEYTQDSGPHDGEPFKFVHAGSLSKSYAPDQLIDAMNLLNIRVTDLHKKINVEFYGEGPLLNGMKKKIDELGLSRCISLAGIVPKKEIMNKLRSANGFLLLSKDLRLHRFGISYNKIFDYMIAGRPVVVASNDTQTPIIKAGSGVQVEPENPNALADAIWDMANLPLQKRRKMAELGSVYVKKEHTLDNWVKLAKDVLSDDRH